MGTTFSSEISACFDILKWCSCCCEACVLESHWACQKHVGAEFRPTLQQNGFYVSTAAWEICLTPVQVQIGLPSRMQSVPVDLICNQQETSKPYQKTMVDRPIGRCHIVIAQPIGQSCIGLLKIISKLNRSNLIGPC